MTDGWAWDESLFAGAAAHYERGRLPYAAGFVAALADELGLDGSGRLLDVGCGPGTVTVPLAGCFAEAVGVDPDAGMLARARLRAARDGVGNVRWVRARAEDLPAGLGVFRVVVFAQSFHWTVQDAVAATVRGMLPPGGAFVHVGEVTEPSSTQGLPHPTPPHAAVAELVRRWLGPVRRAGRGFLPGGTPGGEAQVLAGAGFAGPTRLRVPSGVVARRSVDDVVAWVHSRSDGAPHLFGTRLAEFDAELRALLLASSPGGWFAERVPDTEVRIWRTPRA
ncbi:class I SAM-dependent methyltransferase [Micromonospora carbonacea]|uniref:Methyltransferase domain-containing protein n=1 Tax=Micromonospora carbonacea TaxID=47853 RepID=A0A1C5AHA2_9ACTN|nr:class I SAM-dependent methyltransferase [Micromonospora carbonacea]SCF44590.1 Methyltransferase domain-containing protein [Micromonospora carbonacea]